MARIRYLKPDFFKDEDIATLDPRVRLLYQGLWTIADKEGRLEDRPMRIKVEVFPYDNYDVEKGLAVLSRAKAHGRNPFILRYAVEGHRYIQIVNWHKHQKPHHTEQPSRLPPPSVNGATTVPPPEGIEKEKEKGIGTEKKLEVTQKKLTEFVHMTDHQYMSLVKDYGLAQVKLYVDKVSFYCGANGKTYKRYDLAVRQFMMKDNVKKVVAPKVEKPIPPEERADPAMVHALCQETIAKIGGVK